MKRAILANLAFEYELAGDEAPRVVLQQSERWSHILRLVPGFAEAEPFCADSIYDEVLPWGASAEARRRAGGAARAWPPPDAVRRANDKRTSHAIERELGVALAGAAVASNLEEALALVERIGTGSVVKHPFGVSGRRAVAVASTPDAGERARLKNLLADGRGVVVEPRVEIEREFSLHFDVRSDDVTYVGACELLTDRGSFRGNGGPLEGVPLEIIAVVTEAARRVASMGYAGPLGVDGFAGRMDGERVVRPISEINARWTFGRLALLLNEQLGRPISWIHPPRGATAPATAIALPRALDPGRKSGTWLEPARHGFEWPRGGPAR